METPTMKIPPEVLEQVRALCKPETLELPDGTIFKREAEYMTQKIQRTTNTGPTVDCPDCSKGYVYVGGSGIKPPPGKLGVPEDWKRCERCGGTATVTR